MTFTSISPALKLAVEDVARAIFTQCRCVSCDVEDHFPDAEAAILAFLNACVEKGAGRVATGALAAEGAFVAVELRHGEYLHAGSFPAIIINRGATDDTAKETKE